MNAFCMEKAEQRAVCNKRAIILMECLGVDSETIAEWEKTATPKMTINGSRPQEITEAVKGMIQEVEQNTKSVVYYVICNGVDGIGETTNLLLSPSDDDDFISCLAQAEDETALAYVYNETLPEYSEYGLIFLARPSSMQKAAGNTGLIRAR